MSGPSAIIRAYVDVAVVGGRTVHRSEDAK